MVSLDSEIFTQADSLVIAQTTNSISNWGMTLKCDFITNLSKNDLKLYKRDQSKHTFINIPK